MANGTLSSPLVADLSSSSNGASAVITGFNNTSRGGGSNLVINDKMYYGYAVFEKELVEEKWPYELGYNDESYSIKLNTNIVSNTITYVGSGTVDADKQMIKLPNTFSFDRTPVFTENDNSNNSSSNPNSFPYTYIAGSFAMEDIFTGENAFFASEYATYKKAREDFNNDVASVISSSDTNYIQIVNFFE